MTRVATSFSILGLAVMLGCATATARADPFLENGIESDGPIIDPSVKNIPKFAPGAESAGVAIASAHPAARALNGRADCPPESPCAVSSPARDTPTPLYPVSTIVKTERAVPRRRS